MSKEKIIAVVVAAIIFILSIITIILIATHSHEKDKGIHTTISSTKHIFPPLLQLILLVSTGSCR